jgi:cytochrome b pre-mRNA-processing protein 3
MCETMSIMDSIRNAFGPRAPDPREEMRPLYTTLVDRARNPQWYLDGAPDTLDGRFDVLCGLLSLVLIRLERDDGAQQQSVWLTEIFVNDMDGQLRQIGIGDMIVGKHIGRMMAALGGRLGAYRDAGGDEAAMGAALRRNLWAEADIDDASTARVAQRMINFRAALAGIGTDAILAGQLPAAA